MILNLLLALAMTMVPNNKPFLLPACETYAYRVTPCVMQSTETGEWVQVISFRGPALEEPVRVLAKRPGGYLVKLR